MKMMKSGLKQIAIGGVLAFVMWGVASDIGFAYQGDPVELLEPPKQLEPQTPLEDQIGCSDCWRGPYILDFGQETAPEDLSKLVVEIRSATDDDLILLIVKAFSASGGYIRFRERDVICARDSDIGGNLGHERCEFLTEEQLQRIRGEPIYIFVGNIGARNHRFTLTADWEPPGLREPTLKLISNEPVTREITAGGFTFELEPGKSARLFEFRVPTGAIAMAVRVRSSNPKDINVDAYIGKSIKPEDKPEEKANFALVSELGEEAFIQLRPASGNYWLAVRNRTDKPQVVEVVVTVLMDSRDLAPGQSATGQVALPGLLQLLAQYLGTGSGVLAPTQYKLTLKDKDLQGAVGLQITLSGSSGLSLHIRFGQIVEIHDGRVTADLSLIGPATEKTVVLSGALLKPGIIYLAIEAALGTNYAIRADLIKSGAFGNQTVPIPLEAVRVQLSANP